MCVGGNDEWGDAKALPKRSLIIQLRIQSCFCQFGGAEDGAVVAGHPMPARTRVMPAAQRQTALPSEPE